jgi:hypothetical protein
MIFQWRLHDGDWFASALSGDTRVQYFLIAERVPDAISWDWTVWTEFSRPRAVRHGVALSAVLAMAQAGVTADQMEAERFVRAMKTRIDGRDFEVRKPLSHPSDEADLLPQARAHRR